MTRRSASSASLISIFSSSFIQFYTVYLCVFWSIPQFTHASCITCNVSACDPWFLFYTYAGDSACDPTAANYINSVSGIALLELGTANCSGNVLPWMCASFRKSSEVNQNASCPDPSLPQSQTGSYWCNQVASCVQPVAVVGLACTDSTRWAQPGHPNNNVSDADVERPTGPWIPKILPVCPTVTSSADPSEQEQTSLGTMYDISQLPGCPPIPLVVWKNVSFAKLFPPQCTDRVVQRPGYAYYFYGFVPFVAITMALYIHRRHVWPISARNGPLIYAFIVFLLVGYLLFMDVEIYGTSARCELLAVASTMAGPLFFMPLALRAFRLVFLYRWNSNKRVGKRDWYFDHRWLISPQLTIVIMVINVLLCILAALGVLFSPGRSFSGTLLTTGYCQWYHFTPEVIAFANATLGGKVGPSILNPWGYGPFSPNLQTCMLCELGEVNVAAILGWNFFFISIILVFIFVLRNVADQYWLWRELMAICVANVILFPFAVVVTIPTARVALNVQANDFEGKVVVSVITWDYFWTIVVPLLLSYTRYAKDGALRGGSSRSQREVSRVGPTSVSGFMTVDPKEERNRKKFLMEMDAQGKLCLTMELDDVIEDPVGLECLRNFAVELFKVELVEFYVRIKAYQKIRKEEQMQIEASKIYHTYIRNGAVLQINISDKQRTRYDRMAADGHFSYSQMDNSVTSSEFGPLGLGVAGSNGRHIAPSLGGASQMGASTQDAFTIKTEDSKKKGDMDSPTHHSGDKFEALHNSSPTQTPQSVVPRTLMSQFSESNSNLERMQSHESLAIDLKKESPVDQSQEQLNKDKSESEKLDNSMEKPFRAIDFSIPLKEVRQLIYDDWLRFQQSRHWDIFTQDLQKRLNQPSPEPEEQGLTELHPVTDDPLVHHLVPSHLQRASSFRSSRSGPEPPTPSVTDGAAEASVDVSEVGSRLVGSKSQVSFVAPGSHPDAA